MNRVAMPLAIAFLISVHIAVVVALDTAPARAADVQIKYDDNVQRALLGLPGAVDQCVSSLSLRNDVTACKAVSAFVTSLAQVVGQAQKIAADEKAKADADSAKASEGKPAESKPEAPPKP